jgi:23S rRNA (adenine2030-N6)-methyltransferase
LWVGVNERRVQYVEGDGVVALAGEMEKTSRSDIFNTLIFIDPFDPFDNLDLGTSPMNLFCLATQAGARAVLWYGFRSGDERTRLWDNLLKTLHDYEIDASSAMLWCGEICMKLMDDREFDVNPGVRGCGMLTANLSDETTRALTDLGNELSRIYERSRLHGGHSGAFDFNTVSIW